MFITVTGKDANAPVILNIRHIVGVVSDGQGNVYIKALGDDPAFKIVETIEQMEELLNVAN
jgi:hypothetical protein